MYLLFLNKFLTGLGVGVLKRTMENIKGIMVGKEWTLAVAESISTGNLQSCLGCVSGSSNFFKGGITAYNLGQKVKHLNVEEMHANKVDCVSEQVAIEMAEGATRLFNSRIGIGTTGYAEPYPDKSIEQPYAFFAIWDVGDDGAGKVVVCEKVVYTSATRIKNQKTVARLAVVALEKYLQNQTCEKISCDGQNWLSFVAD